MYKVLFVDRDYHSREQWEKMLDWNGCGFVIENYAKNVISALRLFEQHKHSLIIINLSTCPQDWLLLCERIRERNDVPIILIGGRNDFQLYRKALNLQVSDFLPDPVKPDEIIKSLTALKQRMEADQKNSKQFNYMIKPDPSSNIIEKVKAYVEESINENITLKEISDVFHYNCSYLGQKFKSQENMTFNEYLLKQRMEKAKRLLHNTNMKIYEIANEVGYIELDWFYKKFKLYTGLSASEYRKLS